MRSDGGLRRRVTQLRRGQHGVVSLEYLVIGLAIIVLVGGLAARTDVADTVSCKVGGLFTSAAGNGSASCGGT